MFRNLLFYESLTLQWREHRTEPGTAFQTAETKGPNSPPSYFTYLQRPHLANLNPQKRGGSRPLRSR